MSQRIVMVAVLIAALFLSVTVVVADLVQPVNVQLKEQEPNSFLVQWQVPRTFPVRAMPEPVLPEDCRPSGERIFEEQPGTWLNRQVYRCEDTLAGRSLGIRYPFVVAGQSTMMRIDFLSGEQLIHALNPGEYEWLIPEIDAGLIDNLWGNIRQAVVAGATHFLGGWSHWAFALAIGLLGGTKIPMRVTSAFFLGQLLAVILWASLGVSLAPALAEGGVAIGAVLLAKQVLRTTAGPGELLSLGAAAGLAHGLGLGRMLSVPRSFESLEGLYAGLAVLGMDLTLLGVVVGLVWARERIVGWSLSPALTRGLAYVAGSVAVAAALIWVLASTAIEAETPRVAAASQLPAQIGDGSSVGGPGSRRVAASGSQAPIQSFISVEAFEIRNEILVRVADLASELGLTRGETIAVETQPDVKQAVQALVVPLTTAAIDGETKKPVVDRVDFLIVGTQGVLPRPEPVLEYVDEAFVGVTLVYLTPRTPGQYTMTWNRFPEGASEIPATVSDPEFSQTQTLTEDAPVLIWENNLSVDPVPTVSAIQVEPKSLPIPLVALPLLLASGWFLLAAVRGQNRSRSFVLFRALLALALVVSPIGEMAIALPSAFGSVPSPGEARRILSGVLPNVYRAFEFRSESDAYDRLAVSVTGDTLSDVYLEHRRALEMEERGGARARVEAVEVEQIRSVEPVAEGGFTAEAVWVVGGTVTHFGHRHFRQNRYDARVTLVPVEEIWKIRSIELFDEERLR
jgi:hypothetical protein